MPPARSMLGLLFRGEDRYEVFYLLPPVPGAISGSICQLLPNPEPKMFGVDLCER